MTALDTASHKFVVNNTGNPAGNVPVDMRDALMRLLRDMGLTGFAISNTAPTDKTILWWHKDVRTAKRFVVGVGNWVAITAPQYAMYIFQQAALAAPTEGTVDADDIFTFYDVSAGETKKITKSNLSLSMGTNALFAKVAETVITSPRSYIDILNVSGGSLYFVRATALRASPEPAVDLPTYIQFGNNSTLYASVGDYHKYGSGYSQSVSDKPYFDATSIASGGTTWITGPVIRALPTVDGVRNMVSFGIKYLGSAAKKTSLVNLGAGVRLGNLATIDDDWDRGTLDGVFAVRAAAVAENRLRILTTPGYQFIGGRVSVYSFGA